MSEDLYPVYHRPDSMNDDLYRVYLRIDRDPFLLETYIRGAQIHVAEYVRKAETITGGTAEVQQLEYLDLTTPVHSIPPAPAANNA